MSVGLNTNATVSNVATLEGGSNLSKVGTFKNRSVTKGTDSVVLPHEFGSRQINIPNKTLFERTASVAHP